MNEFRLVLNFSPIRPYQSQGTIVTKISLERITLSMIISIEKEHFLKTKILMAIIWMILRS